MVSASLRETAHRASELLGRIGTLNRQIVIKQVRLDERIKTLKERYGPDIDALTKERDALVNELAGLVVPKFALLAFKRTQTIKLRAGEVSLRLGAESVQFDDDEAVIIKRIRQRGLASKLLRRTVTVHVDKNAFKKLRVPIKGIRVVRKPSLVLKPSRTQGKEIVVEQDKLSVSLPTEL